jgi:hypothetical protein
MELQRNDASNSKVSFELGRFQVSVAGRRGQPGRYEFFAPDSDLEGLGRNAELAQPKTQYLERDLFFSRVIFDAEAADGFVVVFPAVGVNGKLLASRSVPVHLVERQGFPTCVQ